MCCCCLITIVVISTAGSANKDAGDTKMPCDLSVNYCDASQCLENDGFDNDCCGLNGSVDCSAGYTFSFRTNSNGCLWNTGTCCVPDEMVAAAEKGCDDTITVIVDEDPEEEENTSPRVEQPVETTPVVTTPAEPTCVDSACLERGGFDNDCCGIKDQLSCAAGYEFSIRTTSNGCMWNNGTCCTPIPGYEAPVTDSAGCVPSACLENGRFDSDCCGIKS